MLEMVDKRIDLDLFRSLLEEKGDAESLSAAIRRRLGIDPASPDQVSGVFRVCDACGLKEHDSWGSYSSENRSVGVHGEIVITRYHCGRCVYIDQREHDCR